MVSDVQLLGEVDGFANRLARLAGQPDDKVPMDQKTELSAVGGKALRHIDGRALFDVLQDLLIARFISDNQQSAPASFMAFSVS